MRWRLLLWATFAALGGIAYYLAIDKTIDWLGVGFSTGFTTFVMELVYTWAGRKG